VLPLPPLYPITDARASAPLSEQVRRLGEAGFPLVQFRGKPLEVEAQWEELRSALAIASDRGGWPLICVNDRADLAVLAAREGLAPWGLHLGQDDLPAAEAAKLPGLGGLHLGASTHGEAEWAAVDPACDHAGVGPFRATGTKQDHEAPIGPEGLAAGCAALRAKGIAPIAIGGLTLADAEACFRAGAEALAMVGELARAGDPASLGWEVQAARWRARPPFRRGQGLVLAGSSGAGKSHVGRVLAEGLGLPFHDLDEVIEAATRKSISQVFAEKGEGAFRALEAERLPALLERPAVVALGGGAWETASVREAVARSGFQPLWLAESPSRCWARVARDPGRPLAQDQALFHARHRARLARWSSLPMLLRFGRESGELARALLAPLD
jgi:thiamine-phosphate diphosphorylase